MKIEYLLAASEGKTLEFKRDLSVCELPCLPRKIRLFFLVKVWV